MLPFATVGITRRRGSDGKTGGHGRDGLCRERSSRDGSYRISSLVRGVPREGMYSTIRHPAGTFLSQMLEKFLVLSMPTTES